MKNLFLLPTDKPSRLFKVSGELKLTRNFDFYNGSEYQNIYITNDEVIKEGDWIYDISSLDYNPLIHKATNIDATHLSTKDSLHARGLICTARNLKGRYKKIILTTDPELIKDGVQAIGDEFLEWFVKNPSCEFVEVNINSFGECHMEGDNCSCYDTADQSLCKLYYPNYKIIIPQEELKPIHKFNSGLGATLCNECYVIISEGLTEELFCEKCKHKQKLNSLVESWQKRQKEYESLAEKHRDSDHTYKKYTYRAQATRDCWKELLTFNKTTEGYYDDFKMIEGEKIEEAAKRFWKESKANPIEMAIFGAEWQQEQDLNLVQSYLSANLQNIELLEKSYSEEEVLKYLNHLIMMKSSELDKFTDDKEMVTMKWFEQFKKK